MAFQLSWRNTLIEKMFTPRLIVLANKKEFHAAFLSGLEAVFLFACLFVLRILEDYALAP